MLREQFIASVGVSTKPPDTSGAGDAAISVHEYQPVATRRVVYKKSATPQRCLAVSEHHVFAAQANKAVVHVYHREKGNQESTVPFLERITAVSLACHDSVLILGTAEGLIILWEICTGRQVTTSHVHLQAVTALVVDPTGNFLLSASKDSTVLVWSVPDLLSFTNPGSPSSGHLRTFDLHRAEVTALDVGHSASLANFAVSVARDRTCLVWDYTDATVLRQFLLSAVPTCIALDPADRAAYVGYEDGDVQMLDLLVSPMGHQGALQNGRDDATPIQPPPASKWRLPESSHGPVLSIAVSYDGTTILSGHESGNILNWDVARQTFSSIQTTNPLPGPVTNLSFLPVLGFQRRAPKTPGIRIPDTVKPRIGTFDAANDGTVPGNYSFNVQFADRISTSEGERGGPSFDQMLAAPTFPSDLLDEGLNELASWGRGTQGQADETEETTADFMALDDTPPIENEPSLEEENAHLKRQLDALRRVQMTSFEKMERLSQEKSELLRREQKRRAHANGKATNGRSGIADGNVSSGLDSE